LFNYLKKYFWIFCFHEKSKKKYSHQRRSNYSHEIPSLFNKRIVLLYKEWSLYFSFWSKKNWMLRNLSNDEMFLNEQKRFSFLFLPSWFLISLSFFSSFHLFCFWLKFVTFLLFIQGHFISIFFAENFKLFCFLLIWFFHLTLFLWYHWWHLMILDVLWSFILNKISFPFKTKVFIFHLCYLSLNVIEMIQ
jgi:hypothetical protein